MRDPSGLKAAKNTTPSWHLQTLLWDAHFYLAFAFFALILLHVAAALFHALVRRDGVFETMASLVTYGEQGRAPREDATRHNEAPICSTRRL
jgi:hypothetical protein